MASHFFNQATLDSVISPLVANVFAYGSGGLSIVALMATLWSGTWAYWTAWLVVEDLLPAAGRSRPVCLAGRRACSPEDVGGPWGYADFLDAIADPKHERHEEFLEWIGGGFDPAAFDPAEVDQIFATLADPSG